MKLIRIKEVAARTGLARSTIYDHLAKGDFPRPVRLGERQVAFVESEVAAWIGARIAERDAEAA